MEVCVLDGVSIDQLRTFVAVVDRGSFSAAGVHLGRAQSVVSQTLAAMEQRLGLTLFDRTRRLPRLTEEGRALLPEARATVAAMDLFKSKAKGLSEGLEAEVAITVDVMFPIDRITRAVTAFQATFPGLPLRLHVEALGAVLEPVLDGRCCFGIAGTLAPDMPELRSEPLPGVAMCIVVAPTHPLADHAGAIAKDAVARHLQLVLTDRSILSAGHEFGVLSERTWRLADLGAKHAFLRAGLGWGAMPRTVVERDLAAGELVEITVAGLDPAQFTISMHGTYLGSQPPGPAARWLLDRLREDGAPRSITTAGTSDPVAYQPSGDLSRRPF